MQRGDKVRIRDVSRSVRAGGLRLAELDYDRPGWTLLDVHPADQEDPDRYPELAILQWGDVVHAEPLGNVEPADEPQVFVDAGTEDWEPQ
jgi:hypothetical protein